MIESDINRTLFLLSIGPFGRPKCRKDYLTTDAHVNVSISEGQQNMNHKMMRNWVEAAGYIENMYFLPQMDATSYTL